MAPTSAHTSKHAGSYRGKADARKEETHRHKHRLLCMRPCVLADVRPLHVWSNMNQTWAKQQGFALGAKDSERDGEEGGCCWVNAGQSMFDYTPGGGCTAPCTACLQGQRRSTGGFILWENEDPWAWDVWLLCWLPMLVQTPARLTNAPIALVLAPLCVESPGNGRPVAAVSQELRQVGRSTIRGMYAVPNGL